MRRILEKLAQKRKEEEDRFFQKLKEIKEKAPIDISLKSFNHLEKILSRHKDSLKSELPSKQKRGLISSLSKSQKQEFSQDIFNQQVLLILSEFQVKLERSLGQIRDLLFDLTDLIKLNVSLMDAKNKEWDALGNNHVGMIFKSIEWRVDKLAAEYGDVKLLMRTFLLLKEKLNRLLSALEKKDVPSAPQIKEIVEPLKDWRYAGFENRFRGYEEDIKKQQEIYLPYFKNEGKVLDLGCGRGEFMELLEENGREVVGVDINKQMLEICREKGLNCYEGDILEKMANFEDNSLSGIFSSQVIEHLSPDYLIRMIELAYFKLAPSCYIVLETINPTSVFSLVQIYFLDLSHHKPIHPQMIKFLLENTGFEEVEIKYSHPLEEEKLQNLPGADDLMNQNIDNLNKLLYDSPNYAAIGKKI